MSDGAFCDIRIFVGARTALVTGLPECSGTTEAAREGLDEFATDPPLDDAFSLLTTFDITGVDED
jgi:hypothetical protein